MRRRIKNTSLILDNSSGTWTTDDGKYQVAEQEYYTECDEPHPVKLPRSQWHMETVWPDDERKRPYQRQVKGYRCEGGQEHVYMRWHIWDVAEHEYAFDDKGSPGMYDSFRDAAYQLAVYLKLNETA